MFSISFVFKVSFKASFLEVISEDNSLEILKMLQPRKTKYRKHFRGKMGGKAVTGSTIAFGDFGLKALGRGWVKSQQIEAARKAISSHTKRMGKVWIRIFPDKSYTKGAAGARMGSVKAISPAM